MRLKLTPSQLLLEFNAILPPFESNRLATIDSQSNTSIATSPSIQHQAPVRQIQLHREKSSGYGFSVRALPVASPIDCHSALSVTVVSALSANSPADRCRSLYVADRLLAINGQCVRQWSHDQIVRCLKQSGSTLSLLVQNNSMADRCAASNRWKRPDRSSLCWCEPCTARHETEEDDVRLKLQDSTCTASPVTSIPSTASTTTPSFTSQRLKLFHSRLPIPATTTTNTPNSTGCSGASAACKTRSRFVSPLRPFVRASAAYSSLIMTPSNARRADGKENTPNSSSLANGMSTTTTAKSSQGTRRSVRFRSLWRSTCTSKQATVSDSSSIECSPTSMPDRPRSRSMDRFELTNQLHQLSLLDQMALTPHQTPSSKVDSSSKPIEATVTQTSSPLRAGAQPTCRSIKLLHCQLTKFISCTDNVRRTSFELRWPNQNHYGQHVESGSSAHLSASNRSDCGSFCSALIHCHDSHAASKLYDAFDEYIRLLRRQAVIGLNVSAAPNPKPTHLFTWATVSAFTSASMQTATKNSNTSNQLTANGKPTCVLSSNQNTFGVWSPMYILLRGGQLQLWQQTPDVFEHDLSGLVTDSDSTIESPANAHFERLGQLMTNSVARCTFTCCCCAESPTSPDLSAHLNHDSRETSGHRSRRMRSASSTLADCGSTLTGHHSPDSTLGCSIGSSVSSSLALHQSITPPPIGSPTSMATGHNRSIGIGKSTSSAASSFVAPAALHVLNACSTFLRRMRIEELPDRRQHCVQVQCAQPRLQFCLAFENEQQVQDLLHAWTLATFASVQQLSVSWT